MRLPAPRIIAVDDNPKDLRGLAEGLNRYGTGCLEILFTGDTPQISKCQHVRVIFADLHLIEGGASGDHQRHFATIGGLIERSIVPSGPYILILWTKFADQAAALERFLHERLVGVEKPFAVVPLDKTAHLTPAGDIRNIDQLVGEIDRIIRNQPQIAALLNWEERILGAAAETMSAILRLVVTQRDRTKHAAELRRILAHLAVEAVGEDHVEADQFAAINEGLLPILGDRIAFLRSRAGGEDDIWKEAFRVADTSDGLSEEEAAKLNRLLHIAEGATGADRGATIPLGMDEAAFNATFGIAPNDAAKKEFSCANFVAGDASFRWALVQVQAPCDFAQKKAGPLPFTLALELPSSRPTGTSPAALWSTPPFDLEGTARVLRANYRFQISMTETKAKEIQAYYRIREQLLNDLVSRSHAYGARPGTITFQRKAKKPVANAAAPRELNNRYAVSDCTTACITGGQTPLPRSLIRSRRVPIGRRYSSENPIARRSSGGEPRNGNVCR